MPLQLQCINLAQLARAMVNKTIAKEFFSQLEGSWKFTREIYDQLSLEPTSLPTLSQVKGVIEFTKAGEHQLYYYENGNLTTHKGETLLVQRNLIYETDPEYPKLTIRYAEAEKNREILHVLDFSTNIATHTHLCNKDNYLVNFTINSLTKFELRYIVSGPHKNYTSTTIIQR